MRKSILDLTPAQLQEIVQTGTLPENVSLTGIEARDDFEKLYKLRNKPSGLAKYLLNQSKTFSDSILKEKRIELQKNTLNLKAEKVKRETEFQKGIKAHLSRLETKIDYTKILLEEILNKLKKEDSNG